MRGNSVFEVVLSAAVIVVALVFLAFLRLQTGTGSLTSYSLSIEMKQVDSLKVGADVRISGIKVGSVTNLALSPHGYFAVVRMDIRSGIAIPQDSLFGVQNGVTDGAYLSIRPGRSGKMLPPGAVFLPAQKT